MSRKEKVTSIEQPVTPAEPKTLPLEPYMAETIRGLLVQIDGATHAARLYVDQVLTMHGLDKTKWSIAKDLSCLMEITPANQVPSSEPPSTK